MKTFNEYAEKRDSECEDSPDGKHSFTPDYEYDSSGKTINCEYCGELKAIYDHAAKNKNKKPGLRESAEGEWEMASFPTYSVDMSTGKTVTCKYLLTINGKKVPAYRNDNGEIVPAPTKMEKPDEFYATRPVKPQTPQPKPGIFQRAKNWLQK